MSSDFTFLTEEQCFNDEIDVIKKRGTKAAITDFAILLGGYVNDDSHIDENSSLEGRTGYYWTKSDDGDNDALAVSSNGTKDYPNVDIRIHGARPALPFSSISTISTNRVSGRAKDGILEVEYGNYPQTVASKSMQKTLEREYKNRNIRETGNGYTTDSRKYDDYHNSFQAQRHKEYEYNGIRYVRVKANSCYNGEEFTLSNGEKYKDGDNVWVKVEPVKWLVDEKEKIMLAMKILFAGVQFNEVSNYHTQDFDKTDIKQFMDRDFSKDLVQSIEKSIGNGIDDKVGEKKNQNPYNFKFDMVSEEDIIKSAIQSNVSIFLHGKPGCGKSDRVKQLDPDFIELNLSHLDPELLDGLAGEKDGKAVHIRPPWLEELEEKCSTEPNKIHILFLEELTNASPVMQSKAYGIALDKKVAGRWKLPENARVVAAGNELEDSLAANEMAQPLYDRFAHVNIETTVENWLEWAGTPEYLYERLDYENEDNQRNNNNQGNNNNQKKAHNKIHPAICAYIECRGEEALRTPYDRENPQPHADPRRWKMASDMLYASNNPETLRAIVGEDLTRDFISFCQIPTITIKDVLEGNYSKEDLEMDMATKLATISGLVGVDDKNMAQVREFVKQLGSPEMCAKFESQWAHGDMERLEQLQEIKMIEKEEEEYATKKEAGFGKFKKRQKGEDVDTVENEEYNHEIKKEHHAEEAKGLADEGIPVYKKITGLFGRSKSRETNDKDNKNK